VTEVEPVDHRYAPPDADRPRGLLERPGGAPVDRVSVDGTWCCAGASIGPRCPP
jgi:hypothetical protein